MYDLHARRDVQFLEAGEVSESVIPDFLNGSEVEARQVTVARKSGFTHVFDGLWQ